MNDDTLHALCELVPPAGAYMIDAAKPFTDAQHAMAARITECSATHEIVGRKLDGSVLVDVVLPDSTRGLIAIAPDGGVTPV